MPSIERFAELIPQELMHRSGRVFYSGRDAYKNKSPIYLVGSNPAGAPSRHRDETIAQQTAQVMNNLPDNWSAYRDESWLSKPAGTHGMQLRVLHLLEQLGINPGAVPASNLVFPRSARESTYDGSMQQDAELCWGFHDAIIAELKPKVIVCLGATAGVFVCKRLGATKLDAEFVEVNKRKWRSRRYATPTGGWVVTAAHPGVANWKNPNSDPTGLIKEVVS